MYIDIVIISRPYNQFKFTRRVRRRYKTSRLEIIGASGVGARCRFSAIDSKLNMEEQAYIIHSREKVIDLVVL